METDGGAAGRLFCTKTRKEWFEDYWRGIDFPSLLSGILAEKEYRARHPLWARPIVLYGIRKQSHKWIKKQEIAVIIDLSPRQDRARTAETHWYKSFTGARQQIWNGGKYRQRNPCGAIGSGLIL